MKRSILDTIVSYLLSGGLACAILVLGLSLIYWQAPIGPVAAEEEHWPVPFELDGSLLTARAAIVYDMLGEKVLYAKNADEALPLASLTKLIVAHTVLEYREPETPVVITAEAVAPEGDWGFWVGEQWPLGELLRFSLIASSNDAIAAAAEVLGSGSLAAINSKARELGLKETQVNNPTGLDESPTIAGGYGSARDMALLTASFLQHHPTFFEATAAPSVTIAQVGGRTLTATSTATPLLSIPGLIGAKTGYTDLAGGNLVAAFDLELGRPLIVAVLGSTREGRFADVRLLLEAARKK